MSKNQTYCKICAEWTDDLEQHLKEAHEDQADEVEEKHEDKLWVLDESTNGAEHSTETCEICGDEMEEGLEAHLAATHTDRPYDIAETYDEPTRDAVVDGADESNGASTAESRDERQSSSSSRTGGESSGAGAADSSTVGVPGKWYMFGVGGAGNGILDSILLRKKTLENERNPLSGVWGDGGLQGYHMLNSNPDEVLSTYFTELHELDERAVVEDCTIGYGGIGEDPIEGEEVARTAIMDETFFDELRRVNKDDVYNAYATMFVHSLVKGTGTGMTPVIAEYLRNDESWTGSDKPMLSAAIIPNEAKEHSMKTIYGLGGLAKHLSSIIMFSNDRLAEAPDELRANIDFHESPNGRRFGHQKENETLIRFLETFTMTSNRGADVGDDGFDVRDTYQPVARLYPKDRSVDYTPAVVCAPVLGVSSGGNPGPEEVEGLVYDTLTSGRLVEFDPSTAWGGAFLFVGPESKMGAVPDLVASNGAERMVREYSGIAENSERGRFLRLNVNQAATDRLDRLYLFGVMYNPEMPNLERMREEAEFEMSLGADLSEPLNQRWDDVDAIFDHLGINSLLERRNR